MTEEQVTERRKWLSLVLLGATQFMVVLDVAIVNVALPTIQQALRFSAESIQWVSTAYAITFGGLLIAARALQGIGAAIISPAALSILVTTFKEGAERNKALGIWGGIAGFGGVAGVLLGGILVDSLGWRWIFFINVPVGAVVIVASVRVLIESRIEREVRRYDVPEAVSVVAGIMLLVYALVGTID